MRSVPLAVAVAIALGAPSAFAAPPTTPSGLRVGVYSDTAAELFWSRSTDPDGLVRGYEIRRDGTLLDTRDALSYFTDDLVESRAFSFTVTAVDFDGERSDPASVRVVLGGGPGGADPTPPTGGGGAPAAPSGLRTELYSSSAGEVFWDRVPGANLSYEVRLDGEAVATTDGTSLFVDGRVGLGGTGVEVVAIGPGGARSDASAATLGDAGPPVPDPGPGADAPPSPRDARLEVYSSTAAELFWTRPEGVATTRVLRDGEELAASDATSYFDPAREPGRDYAYTLVSRTADGRESAPVTLGEGEAPEPPTGAAPRLTRITDDFATGGPSAGGPVGLKGVSEDGSRVFFTSRADDLVPFVGDGGALYRHDVEADRLEAIVRLDLRNRRLTRFDASADGDAIVYDHRGTTFYAEASDGFGPRDLEDVLPAGGRVTSATLADGGDVLAFGGYRYEADARALERVSKETAPSSSSAENALDWDLGRASSISDDGTVLVYAGEAEPSLLDDGSGFGSDPATFVHDASVDVTRVIGRYAWRLACGSCPPLGGGRAGPIVSGDGSTVFLPTLPPEDFGRVDPDADVSRYDVVSGRLETLDGLRGADQLATDEAGRTLAYRLGGEQRVRLLDTGEDIRLTDRGFSSCGRVCLDGQSLGRGSLVSSDGRTVTFFEYTGVQDLVTRAGTVRVRVRDLEGGITRDPLANVAPVEGFAVERIVDVAASANGRTVAFELLGEGGGARQIWIVRAPEAR